MENMTIMDWVTFWIAVLGFLMSLASWIYTLWVNRKSLKISIQESFLDENNFFILLELVNKSRQPISITTGSIILPSGDALRFGETSNAVFTYTNPSLSGKNAEWTVRLPVKLDSFEAKSVFVEVAPWADRFNQQIPGPCTITLWTSRGRVKKTSSIPICCASWKRMLQRIR